MRRASLVTAVLVVASAALLFALLHPVLEGLPFADDYANLVPDAATALKGRVFVELRPYEFYRPLQAWFVALSYHLTGGTLLLHVAQMLAHVATIVVCLRAMAAWAAGRDAQLVTALFLVTTQLNGPALGGNDTMSIVVGTLGGTLSLVCAFRWRARCDRQWLIASAASLVVALLGKESSIGYVPAVAGVLLLRGGSVRAALLPVGIAAVYVGWRAALGGASPGPEGFALGPNVVANAVRIAFAAAIPVSTTVYFTALHAHDWLVVGAGAFGALGITVLWLAGYRILFGTRGMLLVALTALCVIAPVLPKRHVSELYAYALVPFVGVGLGVAIAALLRRLSPAARWVLVPFLAAVVLSNGHALRFDAAAMASNGARSRELMVAVRRAVLDAPPGARIALVEPARDPPDYSVFRMTGFRLIDCEVVTGDGDVELAIVASGAALHEYDAVYTIEGADVVRIR